MNFLEKHKNKIYLGFWALYLVIAFSLLFYNVYLDCRQEYSLSRNSNIVASTSSDNFPFDKDAPLCKNMFNQDFFIDKKNELHNGSARYMTDENNNVFLAYDNWGSFTYDFDTIENQQYTISFKVYVKYSVDRVIPLFYLYYEDNSYDVINVQSNQLVSFTYTTKPNKTLSHFTYLNFSNDCMIYIYSNTLQLEKGNQATEYEQFYSYNTIYDQGYEDGKPKPKPSINLYDQNTHRNYYNKKHDMLVFAVIPVEIGNYYDITIGDIFKNLDISDVLNISTCTQDTNEYEHLDEDLFTEFSENKSFEYDTRTLKENTYLYFWVDTYRLKRDTNITYQELQSSYTYIIDQIKVTSREYSSDDWYNKGHYDGYYEGQTDGYDSGYYFGYNQAKNEFSDVTMGSVLSDGIGAIANFCKTLLSVEVWGTSLFSIVGSVGVIIIVFVLIKIFLK